MFRTLTLACALSLTLSAVAEAKTCRDPKGHFMACAAAPAAPKACRDAAGHFAKCGAPAVAAAPATPMARAATMAARPTVARAPAGAPTARCKDGSLSFSQHRSGTCAGHHGVAAWM